MITLAHACADPRTMMIVHFDTGLAVTAVKRTRRSNQIASPTLLEYDFDPIYDCYVFKIFIVCWDRFSTTGGHRLWSSILPRSLKMFLL